jgi:hypothetical protein
MALPNFNSLQQKAASEYAVFAAHKNLAKLSLFSHTFTELEGRPGESIAVPVYDLSASGEFNAGTNNYGTGVNEVDGLLVELDKHYVKSVSITDKELAFTGINWVKDTSAALAERITRDINAYTFGLIDATNVTASAAISTYLGATPTLADFAGLYALAENSDIPVDRCVVVLNPTYFSKVLPLVTYNMVGKEDYIETGVIRGLIGFKGVVCSSNLPEGTVGAILLDEAMGLASKYLAPMTPDAYPEAWPATGEDGFTFGFRRFMNLNTGANMFAVDALFGAKLLQPTKCVRLTA